MYKYESDEYFLDLVKNKNKDDIKIVIADLLLDYEGDRVESDAAIEYAISQGGFEWDIHNGEETPNHVVLLNDKFNYEKGELKRNFSKERYERVLKLLEEYLNARKFEGIPVDETKIKPEKGCGKGPEEISTKENIKMKSKKMRPDIYQRKKIPFPLIVAGVIVLIGFLIWIL